MKCPELLRKPVFQFSAFVSTLFFLPYFISLFQGADSVVYTWGFWPCRLIFIAALTVIAAFMAQAISKKIIRLAATALFWAIFEFLIILEAIVICFTGHSFDLSFLLCMNAFSGSIMGIFPWMTTLILLMYFAAAAGIVRLASRMETKQMDRKKFLIPVISIVLLFLPATPLAELSGAISEDISAAKELENIASDPNSIKAVPGKNLVFIVVESLEQNYLNEEKFPGLLPNITKWMNSGNALVFENMTSSSANTFDFLYQSHMGRYMYSVSDIDYADKQFSLTQILQKTGYTSTFLKASSVDFANTSDFAEKIKYEKRMDWLHPEIQPQTTELGDWGIRDYELFEMAKNEFKKLAAEKKPFCFTIVTADTNALNNDIGKKSLDYTLPDGEKSPLLSALHTTDAALGKFLDFIKNSPEGRDTVVVITGDHLAANSRSALSMLEYKPRKNILTFVINGREKGKVSETCWPVDLAPTILYQMDVINNVQFPGGVNVLLQKNAAPRKKLPCSEFVELQKKQLNNKKREPAFVDSPLRIKDEKNVQSLQVNDKNFPLSPLKENIGTVLEFPAQIPFPTSSTAHVSRNTLKIFQTNPQYSDFCYVLCSGSKTLWHFVFGEYNWNKKMLAAVVNGWYKYKAANKFSDLKLNNINDPLPNIADAEIDVSKNIVTLKKDGWSLPLFSKNNTLFPQCAVTAGAVGENGKQNIVRKYFHNDREMNDFYDLIDKSGNNQDVMTVIMPPDSPLHKKFNIPTEKRDHILRLHLNSQAPTELISMRVPGEKYIAKQGKGKFALLKEDVSTFRIKLNGPAPVMDFDRGLCYAMTMDVKSGRVISTRSFKQSRIAAELMMTRDPEHQTLLICGKGSEFLKKYYPALADKNILFSITGSQIRHSVQYSTGNFRIPDAKEPLDVLGGASAILADGLLLISWGNASFAVPQAAWQASQGSGHELIIKLHHHNPADFVLFTVNNPAWLPDIARAWKTDFLILGTEKSKFPSIIKRPKPGRYFLAVSRGLNWELFGSDKVNFSVKPGNFEFKK